MPVYTVKSAERRLTVTARGLLESSENQDVFCQVEGRTTIISIGHRASLRAFHRRRLTLVREGERHRVAEEAAEEAVAEEVMEASPVQARS